MRAIAAAVLMGALALPASAETRCGWVDNPTPGNWFMTDAHNDWALALQGADLNNNWFEVQAPRFAEWVPTNGSYGYGCGCFEGSVNWRERAASWIGSMWAIPLSRCIDDPALPPRY